MASHLEDPDVSSLSIDTTQMIPGSAPTGSETLAVASEDSGHQFSRLAALNLPNRIVREYLGNHHLVFKELDELREKVSRFSNKLRKQAWTDSRGCFQGWANDKSDKHFEKLRGDADNPDRWLKDKFYDMNMKLGTELHDSTNAFSVRSPGGAGAKALNLCMAPGGYTWYFLKRFPKATVKGITLSPEDGGHPMYLPHGDDDPRVQVLYMDITMLAVEFGTSIANVPAQHPEAAKFIAERPFLGETFELVVCDGQVLRTHQHGRNRDREILRLLTAQLILGLNRIKPGGTLIILLHKVDAWDNILLLQTLETFSKIRLYKPKKIHSLRSSFYLIAKNVLPESAPALEAIERWKSEWWQATFGGEAGTGLDKEEPSESLVREVLEQYGARLIEHGQPIWAIQLESMKSSPFFTPGNKTSV